MTCIVLQWNNVGVCDGNGSVLSYITTISKECVASEDPDNMYHIPDEICITYWSTEGNEEVVTQGDAYCHCGNLHET